jgi:hypothetical protein
LSRNNTIKVQLVLHPFLAFPEFSKMGEIVDPVAIIEEELEKPSVGKEEPVVDKEEPDEGKEEPDEGKEERGVDKEEPSIGEEDGEEEPGAGKEEPGELDVCKEKLDIAAVEKEL